MTQRDRLPRAARLREAKTLETFRVVRPRRGRWFAVKSIRNNVGYARIAVRIAKRIARLAVERNKLRRCVKEVFRIERMELDHADFLVALVRPYLEPSLDEARSELRSLLRP